MLTKQARKAILREAEDALELSHSDIRACLQDELTEIFPGQYPYLRDVFGDDESGDVVYSDGSDTWRAPYTIGMANGKRTCEIDDDQAIEVMPRTVYDEEADEQDHYAGMEPAQATEAKAMPQWMRRMVFTERFVPQAERDAADSSDFAGKGKSFPILKPADVMAAVRSMGRAGAANKGADSLKSSIIKIAKRKGWEKYLPQAWQADKSTTESKKVPRGTSGELLLVESAVTLETIHLQEARADYEIKLIAPGKGASAFYPAEVLKRDGPKVFKTGTKIFINHPTAAEEAARPEGDIKNLAGVLSSGAVYHEAHAKGPGLYGRMKVFADHGAMVEEKAPHVGMSIRAGGIAESGQKREGLPVLKQLTHAMSVDVVTEAGAGGMILTEAARAENQQEVEMTEAEVKTLVEGAVKQAVAVALTEATKPVAELTQRALRGDAQVEATKVLSTITLPEASKARVIEASIQNLPLKEGALDIEKFTALVIAEAKREGQYVASITGAGRVLSMGSAAPSKEEREAQQQQLKESSERSENVFKRLGLSEAGAKAAAKGRVA